MLTFESNRTTKMDFRDIFDSFFGSNRNNDKWFEDKPHFDEDFGDFESEFNRDFRDIINNFGQMFEVLINSQFSMILMTQIDGQN